MKQTITQELGGPLVQQELLKQDISNNLRVAIPGIIESFDSVEQVARVQPAIREIIYDQDGVPTPVQLPLLLDVPILMPRAGDYAITLPVTPGDECLVIFADMCIDGWWQSGGVQNQAEQRRHDLSDGFAILGPWSQPRRLTNYSNALRLYNAVTGAGITIDSQGITITGKLTVTGDSTLTGAVVAGGVDLVGHTHAGVHGQTGGPQ